MELTFWNNFGIYVFSLLFLKIVIQVYLNNRQKNFVQIFKDQVPTAFSGQISLEEHQKAASYTQAKMTFSSFQLIFDFFITLFWLYFSGFHFLQTISMEIFSNELYQGLCFFALLGLIGIIVNFPVSYYQTFVLEEKFGFNKTTLKTFITDQVKQIILSFIIGGVLLTLIMKIMTSLGSYWWFWAWITICTFQVIMMWAYPSLIAPLFNKFEPLPEGETKTKIEALLIRATFNSNGLFVMDASKRSSHGNAYFTGFGKNKRIVFFDTLLKNLIPSEIEAVLAHELGHFKKKHIHKMIIVSFIITLISFYILGYCSARDQFYNTFGLIPSSYSALVLFTVIFPALTFFLTPIMSQFSRKHEYEADFFASEISDALSLQNALVKLYKENASTLTPDPLYSKFYHSHPSAWERIEYLKGLKKQ